MTTPETDEARVLRIGRFVFDGTTIEADTAEDGLVTFKPEPRERGRRIARVVDVLDKDGPFQPAQAPAVELEQPAPLFPSLERLAWERGR